MLIGFLCCLVFEILRCNRSGSDIQVSFQLENDPDNAEMVAWTTTPWWVSDTDGPFTASDTLPLDVFAILNLETSRCKVEDLHIS